MLVYLAMTLSTVHGWGLPSDNKTSSLSSNESAITRGADGARARRQLQGCNGGCDASWLGLGLGLGLGLWLGLGVR